MQAARQARPRQVPICRMWTDHHMSRLPTTVPLAACRPPVSTYASAKLADSGRQQPQQTQRPDGRNGAATEREQARPATSVQVTFWLHPRRVGSKQPGMTTRQLLCSALCRPLCWSVSGPSVEVCNSRLR